MSNSISQLQQIRDLCHVERIGAHSHIHSLDEGLVGQSKARKAASVIVGLIQANRLSGRGILLAGRPGTGKTALALAISQSLRSQNPSIPFTCMAAPEIFSLSLGKTEALTQALRRSIAICIKEATEVIQGEVVEISTDFSLATTPNSLGTGKIVLRTTDMEAVYDLGKRMIDCLARDKIAPGDVISIDKASGKITRLGRSFSRAKDFDATAQGIPFVPCPEGELQRHQTTTHTVSLHDIDVVNSGRGESALLGLFSGQTGEISAQVRESVDTKIATWLEEGKCKVVPGVLFIDEVHMLDVECFSFLNRALEAAHSPLLIVASNRGICRVRGASSVDDGPASLAPHGVPADFLDRMLIIATEPYNQEEIRQILAVRAAEEDVKLGQEALDRLVQIAMTPGASLRYAMQLIMAANCARARRRAASGGEVELVDVERVWKLFLDAGRSAESL